MLELSSPPGTARQTTGEPRQDRKVATVSRLDARRIIPGDLELPHLAYLSLYRKYRSQTFSDLIGQGHVVRTLQQGIQSGRIAHSYLFTGPRGTGKTSSARLLAKALNCEKGPTAEPCNVCENCVSITEGRSTDVYEMDAASESGVDEVRETIVNVVEYQPLICRYKVFIIDEVHDLSAKAFDALLKSIEEPPPHIIFVLATTEYNKVPPTIRSRCQKFEFHRASLADLIRRLEYVAKEEGAEIEPAALSAIAKMADGGFRDALTLLEQAIIASAGKITLTDVYDQLGLVGEEVTDRFLTAMKDGEVGEIVALSGELMRLGRDPRAILDSLLYRLADLTRVLFGVDTANPADASRQAATHEFAARIGQEDLLALRAGISEAHRTIRDITLPRLWLESELIRISGTLRHKPARASAAASHPQPAASKAPAAAPKAEVKEEPVHAAANGTPKPAEAKPEGHAAVEVVVPEGATPELAKAIEAWAAVLNAMPPTVPIRNRLDASKAVEFADKVLIVELGRKMDVDWMQEKPDRQGYVKGFLVKQGLDWDVKYRLGADRPKETAPQAVELPAEGQPLAKMVRDMSW